MLWKILLYCTTKPFVIVVDTESSFTTEDVGCCLHLILATRPIGRWGGLELLVERILYLVAWSSVVISSSKTDASDRLILTVFLSSEKKVFDLVLVFCHHLSSYFCLFLLFFSGAPLPRSVSVQYCRRTWLLLSSTVLTMSCGLLPPSRVTSWDFTTTFCCCCCCRWYLRRLEDGLFFLWEKSGIWHGMIRPYVWRPSTLYVSHHTRIWHNGIL